MRVSNVGLLAIFPKMAIPVFECTTNRQLLSIALHQKAKCLHFCHLFWEPWAWFLPVAVERQDVGDLRAFGGIRRSKLVTSNLTDHAVVKEFVVAIVEVVEVTMAPSRSSFLHFQLSFTEDGAGILIFNDSMIREYQVSFINGDPTSAQIRMHQTH